MGFGKAALYLYHRPRDLLRLCLEEGGPYQQWRTEQGRRAMLDAALRLPPLHAPEPDRGARIAFLSGSRYWYQTVFCFASLQIHVPFRITPLIFDDGSLDNTVRAAISRVIPWALFTSANDIEVKLDRALPANGFPRLRSRRREYPHLRKLIDIHLGASGWNLVLDSDMLAFRRPDELIAWFEKPHTLYMQDVKTSYGYPCTYLSGLAGRPLPEHVNVGLYSLFGPDIDWHAVEYWCGRQLDEYGGHFWQEQALTGMLIAQTEARPLSATFYRVLPDLEEGKHPTAVLHHYVAYAKRSYFQYAWRRVREDLGQTTSQRD